MRRPTSRRSRTAAVRPSPERGDGERPMRSPPTTRRGGHAHARRAGEPRRADLHHADPCHRPDRGGRPNPVDDLHRLPRTPAPGPAGRRHLRFHIHIRQLRQRPHVPRLPGRDDDHNHLQRRWHFAGDRSRAGRGAHRPAAVPRPHHRQGVDAAAVCDARRRRDVHLVGHARSQPGHRECLGQGRARLGEADPLPRPARSGRLVA